MLGPIISSLRVPVLCRAALLVAAGGLLGCETVGGLGKDIQTASGSMGSGCSSSSQSSTAQLGEPTTNPSVPATGSPAAYYGKTVNDPAQERDESKQTIAAVQKSLGGPFIDSHNKATEDVADYVNTVGQEIAKQSAKQQVGFNFFITESDEVNHYSIPEGNAAAIFVTRGLLDAIQNEAQLASVLAQEVANIDYNFLSLRIKQRLDAIRQNKQNEQTRALLGAIFARNPQKPNQVSLGDVLKASVVDKDTNKVARYDFTEAEVEAADDTAIRYLSKCGYPPSQYRIFMENMIHKAQVNPRYQELIGTHGLSPQRLKAVVEDIKTQYPGATAMKGAVKSDDYQRNVLGPLAQLAGPYAQPQVTPQPHISPTSPAVPAQGPATTPAPGGNPFLNVPPASKQ